MAWVFSKKINFLYDITEKYGNFFLTILVIFRWLCKKKEKYKIFYRFSDHLLFVRCICSICLHIKHIKIFKNTHRNKWKTWKTWKKSITIFIKISNDYFIIEKVATSSGPSVLRTRFHPSKVALEFTYLYGRDLDEERKITMVCQSRFHAHAWTSRNAFRDAKHMYTKPFGKLLTDQPTNHLNICISVWGKEKKEKKNRIKVEGRGKRRIRSIRKIDRTIEGGEIDIKGDEVEIWLGHGSMWRVSKDSKASTCFPRSLPTNPERPLKELQRVRGWAGLFSHVAREKKDHYGVTGRRGGWLVFTRLSN